MSNESRKPISEKQAAARRENGKKSRGPVTAEGKRRSSENSTVHGYWARQLGALRRGPLREDPDEIEQFVLAVMDNLNPADHFLLRQAAFDVGDKMWRLTRAQRRHLRTARNNQGDAQPGNTATLQVMLSAAVLNNRIARLRNKVEGLETQLKDHERSIAGLNRAIGELRRPTAEVSTEDWERLSERLRALEQVRRELLPDPF